MRLKEAYQVLSRQWTDQLVTVSLGTSTYEWHKLHRDTDRVWFHQPTMGLTSSVALGLAVNLPQARVWVMEGDGGLVMNFGGLLAEAEHQPPNLIHFVTSNRSYRTIGGYPLPNGEQTNYVALAHSLGIKNAYHIKTVEDCEELLPRICSAGEFALVVFEVEHPVHDKPAVPWEGSEMKYRFARHIERQFGVKVLGSHGY